MGVTMITTKRKFGKEEVREEVYDGEIKASETVGKEDVQIQFLTPENKLDQKIKGRQMGKAIRWHSRNKTLDVKVHFQDKVFEIEKKLCICAYRTEMPPKSKLPPKYVQRPQKDGTIKRIPNPLYRLKLMEMTKKDRDKLKVIWE